MKYLVLFIAFFSSCSYEWQVTPTRVIRPSSIFCFSEREHPQCFNTAEQCTSEENIVNSNDITEHCRAVHQ